MPEDSKNLVVDLGEEMGASDCIKIVKIEDYIRKIETTWVYLGEGGLMPFMEGMEEHDEHISMQFINSWTDKKVNINGMMFEIMEEIVARVGELSQAGKSWRK